MSFLQLRVDLTTQRPNANNLEISKTGLKVSSPVIGLLIFLASIYFFSIYVEKIYPVTFLRSGGEAKTIDKKTEVPAATGSLTH